jgi:adenylate cyclase
VRLACRLRPSERVVLEPVLDPQTAQVCASELSAAAVERDVALLFIKLSGWTSRDSRMRSPHDTVYALNRVLDAVWQAVSAAGGHAGRFDNEGASATFGIEDEIEDAARQALAAAAAVEAELTRLNAQLMHEVGLAAEFVMALHVGHAAIGSVGRSGDRTRLPVGEVVRVGRALREHAVAVQARFVISRAAAEAAHGVAEGDTWQPVAMPGGDTAVEAMVLARVPGVAR